MLLLVVLGLQGCSSRKKNNATTRAYHAFFAKYNTFYNGSVAFNQGHKAQLAGHTDNYLELLPLLITSNENTQNIGSTNFDRAIEKAQKAIKNHSIKRKPKKPAGRQLSQKQRAFYAQREFNPFLWRAWLMMADAQFLKGDFTEAASTYIYVSRLYENDDDIVAQTRIGLAKCYTELGWLYEAEELLQRAERDTIPSDFAETFAVAKGNLLLRQGRIAEAIPHIETGIRRDNISGIEKAREYYLLGQLYARIGDKKNAYRYFGKTISTSPPYELEFNARIRQTEMASDEDHRKILRKLKRMARSPKNKEYLSQIYYAIGNIHISTNDTTEAIKAYETGVAEGATSGYGTGMLHLSLANIYWEKEKFSKAYENYSKALPLLTEETEGYEIAKFRGEKLGGIVEYTDIVDKKSELLYWATLTPEELYPIIDALIEEEERLAELRRIEEEKNGRENGGSELENASTQANMTIPGQDGEAALWYFYNPQLVSQGIRSFRQEWGDRELKDYWRFSNDVSALFEHNDTIPQEEEDYEMFAANDSIPADSLLADIDASTAEPLATDPTTREYYIQQIPTTEEQLASTHTALSDALFEAGIRFKDDFGDKRLTLKYLERLVNEYPDHTKCAEAYYHLFLACSRWNEPEKAEHYSSLLIEQFPDNDMATRIQQPDFFESAATRRQKEDSIYVKAYAHFTAQEYDDVIRENAYALEKYPSGSHRARFMFIDAMSKLYTDRQDEALSVLQELVGTYSSDSISRIAGEISNGIKEGRLLQSGISASIWSRKADGTITGNTDSLPQFSAERNEPYYFVLAFPNGSVDQKRLLFEVARYNFSRYMVRNFDIAIEEFAEITLFEVKEFLSFDEAFVYRKRLYGDSRIATLLEGINSIIISKTNLDLLLQYYSFDDYRQFYEETFLNIPEVEIDGYTLDEPDFGDDDESNKTEE